ncbi:MAG: hypothetical protein ACREBE_21990 [bacterium]
MQQRVTVQEGAAGVVVRRYQDSSAYQADAGSMGAAGWFPIQQLETTGKFPAAAVILAAMAIFVAFFLSLYVGLGLLVIAILVGIVSRKKELVVTYRQSAPAERPE